MTDSPAPPLAGAPRRQRAMQPCAGSKQVVPGQAQLGIM
jgi:hypothetical protein